MSDITYLDKIHKDLERISHQRKNVTSDGLTVYERENLELLAFMAKRLINIEIRIDELNETVWKNTEH
jgi:hypothetical protein